MIPSHAGETPGCLMAAVPFVGGTMSGELDELARTAADALVTAMGERFLGAGKAPVCHLSRS